MHNRSFLLTAAAVVVAALGCGGDESTNQVSAPGSDASNFEASGGGAGGNGTGGSTGNAGTTGNAGATGSSGSDSLDAAADLKSMFDRNAPTDAPSSSDAVGCGAIGADCPDAKCAANLECVDLSLGSACAPKHAMCGGIVAMDCPSEAPKCVYLSGDVGICLTQAEMNCFCNKVGGRAAGCGV